MKSYSAILIIAATIMLAMTLPHRGAQAEPPGWKCSYGVTPAYLRGSRIFYACYGKSLSETRARARAQCRRLDSCETGACIPLEYPPRPSCGRD